MWALFALVASLVVAQDVQLPSPPRGFSQTQADMVVDAANVLSADAVARINRIVFDVKAKSGGEIVVVTLPDLAGRDVGDVALRIGREWKVGVDSRIGDRSRNAGVVILVVPKESSRDGRGYISIQTGQGTEGFITDATAGDIRREAIPYFQQRDYSTALELISVRVAQRFEREFGFALDTALAPASVEALGPRGGGIPPQLLLVVFVVLLILFSSMARASQGGGRHGCLQALIVADAISHSRGRSHWGGGGFGGGGAVVGSAVLAVAAVSVAAVPAGVGDMAKMTLEGLVAQLSSTYGDELVGVALYGSAARGEQATRLSDLNVLVVVQRITMEHLRKEGAAARAWREAGNPPPLTMTRAEWLGSADIFPIEYADILAHHKVLAGTLPLQGVVVERADLRLQLEHEAMSKLLRLRHAVLEASGDQKALLLLLEQSSSAMLVLLRATLRLAGIEPPNDSEAVCDRFATQSGRDASSLKRIVRHNRGTEVLTQRDGAALVEQYLAFAESLVGYLDAFSQTVGSDGGFPA